MLARDTSTVYTYVTAINNDPMTEEEIKKRVEEIEEIYVSYIDKLSDLRKEQDKIIVEFEKVLTGKKMMEIKKSLGII